MAWSSPSTPTRTPHHRSPPTVEAEGDELLWTVTAETGPGGHTATKAVGRPREGHPTLVGQGHRDDSGAMSPQSDSLEASVHFARRIVTELPVRLRSVLRGVAGAEGVHRVALEDAVAERLAELEHRVLLLGDAIAILARGLEQLPSSDIDDRRRADAAQQAHRILIAEHLTSASAPQ